MEAVLKKRGTAKTMTKRNKAALIVIPLMFLAGVAIFLFCYIREGFTGSCVKNPDAYLLDQVIFLGIKQITFQFMVEELFSRSMITMISMIVEISFLCEYKNGEALSSLCCR